ncbi:hypothetical protein GCM10010332_23810 [Streptomyces albogriseolus]|nr:hypothetical protein GCM10010332_23810 [Streptomyces albogriseolus]
MLGKDLSGSPRTESAVVRIQRVEQQRQEAAAPVFGVYPRPQLGRGRLVAGPEGWYISVTLVGRDHPTGQKTQSVFGVQGVDAGAVTGRYH